MTGQYNTVWNCVIDWQDLILADQGAYGWGEMAKAWTLCLVEAQSLTVAAINADPRTQSILLPNISIENVLSVAQRNNVETALQNVGFNAGEISVFDLVGKNMRQIFNWANRGICARDYDEQTKTITFDGATGIGFHTTLDAIIDNFNWMKKHYAVV